MSGGSVIGRVCLGCLALLAIPVATCAGRITGQVRDRAGHPIELANVRAPELRKGAVTDADGRFELTLPAGPVELEVTQLGYERAHLRVAVAESTVTVAVTLADAPVPVSEVRVEASSFGKAGRSEGAVLSRRDVVSTPGGTADVFQSLRTLPGINAPDEGAAVYVRGGDPRETLIRLDGGEIGHPYHYESASGGLFSVIDSYMLQSAFFSSGGFSAKYGGVLSGVLDIQSQDPLDLRTVSIGGNMAGWSASGSWALVPGRLSAIGSFGQGLPDLLFRLYGTNNEYEVAPTSTNAFVRLLGRYSSTGRVSLSYLEAGDQLAAWIEQLNVVERYQNDTRNRLVAAQFSDEIGGRLALRGQASGQYYRADWSYGTFGAAQTERNAEANLDAVWDLDDRHQVSAGFNLRRPDTEIHGRYPADSTDLGAGAPTVDHETRVRVDYPGAYLEDKVRVAGPIYASLGVRADHATPPGVWTTDPRASLAWRIDEHQTVRLAGGRYHELADPADQDPVYGNSSLRPLTSDHLIAGYEWKSEYGNVRVETYEKRYRDLVIDDPAHYYVNGGTGYARGVDAFVQGTYHWLSGWVSYGYMDTKRREGDDPAEVPSPYGVRHSATLVSRYRVNPALELGVRYTTAIGRPYTPVVDRIWDPARGIWHPVYGDHGSATYPDYHRLDVRLTRLFSLPAM
ncbi:MAG TPA: TonB-dependent receptor, partial [Dongiaceae bacterium]|nr:TonB-dependent receptor [Dongiaceae bacterium]